MKNIFRAIIVVLVLTLATGCGGNKTIKNENNYYDGFPDVLDFGLMSGLEPEIHHEAFDDTTTYLYHIEEKVDQEVFANFVDNLVKNQYEFIYKRKLMEDGGYYDSLENDKTQILIGEYFDSEKEITYKLLISLRPKYLSYDGHDSVPDYGKLSNQSYSESHSRDNAIVYIYEDNTYAKEYMSALSSLDYTFINSDKVDGEGDLFLHKNESYNVTVINYPDYIAIVIETLTEDD